MPVDHYENFPVASILLPRELRPAVEAIYAFARSADDFADEGDASPDERIAALNAYELQLDRIEAGKPSDSQLFKRLSTVIREHGLPIQAFRDLLSAFKQDVTTTRYATYAALLDYCRRSANPVGTLMLHLYKAATPENLKASDAICTALQLINFWQDVAVDWRKQRVYLPEEDLLRHGVPVSQIEQELSNQAWQNLMRFEVERTRALMLQGAPLALHLPGRIGWELRMVVHGGLRILERIEQVEYDVFRKRPALKKTDWLCIVWRSIRMRGQAIDEDMRRRA